jgi:mannosyltransferase OCH1-like enzyme
MSLPLHSSAATRQRKGGGGTTTTTRRSINDDVQSDNEEDLTGYKKKKQQQQQCTSMTTACRRMKEGLCETRRRRMCTVAPLSLLSLLTRRETYWKAWHWGTQNPRHVLAICCLIAIIIRPSITWKWYIINFGHNYLQGGSLGRRIERWSTQQLLQQKLQREQIELQRLGIVDYQPPLRANEQPFRALNLNFDTAYRTMLVQRERRAKTLAMLERQAEATSSGVIPKVLWVPQTVEWVPPRPKSFPSMERLFFTDDERRQSIHDLCPPIVQQLYDDNVGYKTATPVSSSRQEKIDLWAVCTVYYYGGTFVGSRRLGNVGKLDISNDVFLLDEPMQPDATTEMTKKEVSSLVYYINSTAQDQSFIALLRAPPRNKVLAFLMEQFSLKKGSTLTQILSRWIPLFTKDVRYLRCSSLDASAKHCQAVEAVTDRNDMVSKTIDQSTIVRVFYRTNSDEGVVDVSGTTKISVSITRDVALDDAEKSTPKQPLEDMLYQRGIRPSWICMRCLMMPTYGRMSKCTQFCNPAFTQFVCQRSNDDTAASAVRLVPVTIRGQTATTPDFQQIPKIIHQTWFEDVTLDRYPQLARVQNSWKQQTMLSSSNWEYRLYTDDSARRYILDNFPSLFAQAFDTLIPGAYKADFFRYLVLMKEGGIYADVDVMLETNLDHLIRPGLSFFVPRDVVGECVDQAFCLWNGLIGAVPGHPIIIQAVERLVNHILNRADVHDMHRAICQNDPNNTEIWKVYTHPILSLSGPCALGIAMNEALGRPSLQAIETGWMSLEKAKKAQITLRKEEKEYTTDSADSYVDYGDALILILDKHDLGGFRFSDPERNLIVASTDLAGLEKKARSIANPTHADMKREAEQNRRRQQQGHYSKAGHGSLVWGIQGIYKDALVSRIRIHFVVEHES